MSVQRNSAGTVLVSRTYMMDGLGNVVGSALDGSSGAAIIYDSWGNVQTDSTAMMRLNTLRFGYKGMLYDETTGLYNARARWYDPEVGRFISEDPIGLAGGMNQYAFAGTDPVNGSDPSGLLQPGCWSYTDDSGTHIVCEPSHPSGGSTMNLGSLFASGTPPWMQGSNPAMSFFGQFAGTSSGGGTKGGLRNVLTTIGGGGAAAGVVEAAGAGRRIGSNLSLYGPKFFGNQSVATADLAAIGRSAGYVFFAGGEAVEAYNWRTGGESSTTFFTNSGVALTSLVVGGATGGLIGGLYFGVEHTIGWSNVVGVSDCSYARGKGLPCP